jgi:hypothetical protein
MKKNETKNLINNSKIGKEGNRPGTVQVNNLTTVKPNDKGGSALPNIKGKTLEKATTTRAEGSNNQNKGDGRGNN